MDRTNYHNSHFVLQHSVWKRGVITQEAITLGVRSIWEAELQLLCQKGQQNWQTVIIDTRELTVFFELIAGKVNCRPNLAGSPGSHPSRTLIATGKWTDAN